MTSILLALVQSRLRRVAFGQRREVENGQWSRIPNPRLVEAERTTSPLA
jgi:hypothetical protein